MKTKANSCHYTAKLSAFAAWVLRHRYGCLQWLFFSLTAVSLYWIVSFGDSGDWEAKGFWFRCEGYLIAGTLPLFLGTFLCEEPYRTKWDAFFFCVLWAFLFTLCWCAYFGISYAFPLIAASCVTGFYKKIRRDDSRTTNSQIVGKIILYWVLALIFAAAISYVGRNDYLRKQQFIREALHTPVIELVDIKNDYIYTKEYGLERTIEKFDIPAGRKIHRLRVKEGEIFILRAE